jgi:dTDP-4-dehydrorhamnose reductase
MHIFVTGAGGQLGAVIVRQFQEAGDVVTAATRQALDLRRHADVMAAIRAARPDAIVNCAAYNDVDGAEDDIQQAFETNAFAVRSLARAAREAGAALVHYSTDFVFDGETDRPYTEEDRPRPLSVYASSKLAGEWFAADVPRHYVLRVESLFGGPAARSSVDRILDALAGGREARVFVDRVVSPSYVEDVAAATRRLLAAGAPAGLYHCVNGGHTTWYELGRRLASLAGADEARLVPVPVGSAALRARRPRYAALSNAKLAAVGVAMPPWEDAVARYVAQRQGRVPGRDRPAT